ncbi:MAG: hypothetical protein L0J75_02945 [Alkalibacterium sp.]|nr:hypothetical protein [Alkalibacterium sp.]
MDFQPIIDWYLKQTGKTLEGGTDGVSGASASDHAEESDAVSGASVREEDEVMDAVSGASVKG